MDLRKVSLIRYFNPIFSKRDLLTHTLVVIYIDTCLISEETNHLDKEEDKCQYSSRENVSSYSSNIQDINTLSQNTSIETGKNSLWRKYQVEQSNS